MENTSVSSACHCQLPSRSNWFLLFTRKRKLIDQSMNCFRFIELKESKKVDKEFDILRFSAND